MYKFKDTVINNGHCSGVKLPTSAMNYNGIFFEDLIEGYRTLSVSGREMISASLNTTETSNKSLVLSQRLLSRVITVRYQIRNRDPESILVGFRRLMEVLYRTEDVPIYFNDEKNILYRGRYQGADEVPGNVFEFSSSFTIFCGSAEKESFKLFEATSEVIPSYNQSVIPEVIKVIPDRDGGLEVTNGRQSISLKRGNFKKNDYVEIGVKEGIVTVDGVNKTNWLELTSDFENFTINRGEKVISNNGKATVYYREVYK